MALSACGAAEEDKAAEAVSAGLMKEQDDTFQVTQEEADCVGEGFVDELGVDKLVKDAMMGGEDMEAGMESCIDDALTDDATFAEDQEAAAEAMAPLQECRAGR